LTSVDDAASFGRKYDKHKAQPLPQNIATGCHPKAEHSSMGIMKSQIFRGL
jgi:hypothetical protein